MPQQNTTILKLLYSLFHATLIVALTVCAVAAQTTNPFRNPAPAITYPTPHTFRATLPITPIELVNTGDAIPVNGFFRVIHGGLNGERRQPSSIIVVAGTVYVAFYGTKNLTRFENMVYGGPGASPVTWSLSFSPSGVAVDASGEIALADPEGHTIKKLSQADGAEIDFAGSGVAGFTNGPASLASFNKPYGVAMNIDGNIFVADMNNHAIRKISTDGTVSTVAGTGIAGHVDGAADVAQFNHPGWLVCDNQRNIYVSEIGAIRKITPEGVVTTIAGAGAAVALNSNFEGGGLKIDDSGNIFVADRQNGNVFKITPQNELRVVAGANAPGEPLVFSNNRTAFNLPRDIALDYAGNLYVVEGDYNSFFKLMACGYTIDKPLPPGLVFDYNTGVISGTPTTLWPRTDYTVTAFMNYQNIPNVSPLSGSNKSSATLSIEVTYAVPPQPSVITFPPQSEMSRDANNYLDPKATSTNPETPIVYESSSNTNVAVIENGLIKILGPGITVIKATQAGNLNYLPAVPAEVTITIQQQQQITFGPLPPMMDCDADFAAGATSNADVIPITYTTSDPTVATVNSAGIIDIIKAGSVTITASQAGNNIYIAASPVSQVLTVTAAAGMPPTVAIATDADIDNIFAGLPVTFTATTANTGTNTTYQWRVNTLNAGTNSATFTTTTLRSGDVVTCTIFTTVWCNVPVTSLPLRVTVKPPLSIEIKNAFTPNGDGINDKWEIPDLQYYPECLMNVYTRDGKLVFQSRGYGQPWDGRHNGNMLPAASYYYVLSLGKSATSGRLSGSITIIK